MTVGEGGKEADPPRPPLQHKQQFVEFLEAEDGPGAAGNYKEVITQTIGTSP